MLDIVSKYFHDNFVNSFYMGYTIDIYEFWKYFKEGNLAMEFYMKTSVFKELKIKNLNKLNN